MNAKKSKSLSLAVIKDIKRETRRHYSSEEKIRIVMEGFRGEVSVAELCRREGINANLYYKWSKDFMEAGKNQLNGDTLRQANTDEVEFIRKENDDLKLLVAELSLKNRALKKHCLEAIPTNKVYALQSGGKV